MATEQPKELFREACGSVGPLVVDVQNAGGQAPERREFGQPFLVIGREPKTDWPLNDPAVSYRHAYIQILGGRVFCVDLFTRTGVRWGHGARSAGWVTPDQPLGIGPFTVQVPNATPPDLNDLADPMASRLASQDPLPPVNLEILLDYQTVVWSMNRVLALVGQEPRCKVHFKAKGVSTVHCSLVRTPQGLWVVDLNSSTGTTVNGQPVRWAHLVDGDELRVGEMRIRILYPVGRPSVGSTATATRSGLLVQPSTEVENLRLQLDELTRSLTAADEDRAERIRSGAEAASRWEAEREALERRLIAEFQNERQSLQEQVAELRDEVAAQTQREQDQRQTLQAEADRVQCEAEGLRSDLAAAHDERETLRRERDATVFLAADRLRQLTDLRTETDTERRQFEQKGTTLHADHNREVQALQVAFHQREEELATARAEINQLRQMIEDRAAQLELEGTQIADREREWLAKLGVAQAEVNQARQAYQTELAMLRREVETLQVRLNAEQSLVANLQSHRQTLQDEAVALRQDNETLRNQLESQKQEQPARLAAIAPDPVLANLTEQFRLALARFTGLVDQVDSLYAKLWERSHRQIEARRGVLSRFLGETREEREETETAVERRLAALRADAIVEQERTALLASEAARADLERQLAETRRQLEAVQNR